MSAIHIHLGEFCYTRVSVNFHIHYIEKIIVMINYIIKNVMKTFPSAKTILNQTINKCQHIKQQKK